VTSVEAPSVAAYRSAVRAFRARYPWVRAFEAFNEPNHSTQPTYRHPELAAGYWRALRADCRRSDVAAGGLTGFSARTRHWFARYRRALHARPRTWAFHNYADVNRGSTRQVRAFLAATDSSKVWLTETAGVLRMRGHRVLGSVRLQATRERTAWRALRALPRVTRVYHHGSTSGDVLRGPGRRVLLPGAHAHEPNRPVTRATERTV
jgi:hypothetical protein